MLVYFIFVAALAATDAISNNNTLSKDKRQVQGTQNFIPSNQQARIGGQQHYTPNNEQIAAISPNYYRYVQKLLQNQQQPQQLSESSKENAAQNQQHYYNAQPANDKQFVYFNEPQIQYQQEVEQQPRLEPKVISEEEYLELVRRQNEENVNNTATLKYPQNKARQYKFQHKDYQRGNVANEHPQSYLKSYVNPLGEFSLEKELAQLEKSNKAVYQNSERDTEQTVKQDRYEFKPSLQFASYQPDQFLPPEYGQFNGLRPVSQKLIASPYERDESVPQKSNNQPEYQFRYAPSTESPVKYYQEATKTAPKNYFVQLPKHQYLAESDNGAQANEKPTQAKKNSQTIYQKPLQQTSPSEQQSQKSSLHRQPTKTGNAFTEKLPQFQSNNHNAPSRSAIFVSQSTGVKQQKPQEEIQQLQLQQQQYKQPQQPQQYEQPQQVQQYEQYEQPQQTKRLPPPPNPNRPLTQEEFQALVDAGYNVKAIPIAVPVPVSAEAYAQHHQQQQLQHQQQIQQQHHQQYQQPFQQPIRPQSNPSIRPQPSNKHFVRYQHQPTTEGVLSSYLRPFLDQYNNFMGGKI